MSNLVEKSERDRKRGALIGLAVGDGVGAAVEFMPPGSFKPVTSYRAAVLAADWQPLQQLRRLCPLHPEIDQVAAGSCRDKVPPEIVGSGYVTKSLEAALWAFHDARDSRQAIVRAVNLGNDADTTGAVCGQLAGGLLGGIRDRSRMARRFGAEGLDRIGTQRDREMKVPVGCLFNNVKQRIWRRAMVSITFRVAMTVLALLTCVALPAWATILPFDTFPPDISGVANYDPLPQTYGDNVSSDGNGTDYLEGNGFTPNVEISYAANPSGDLAWYADGIWSGATFRLVPEGEVQHGSLTYTFTPDAGYGVRVNSFIFDDYATWQTLDEQMEWRLWGDSVGGALLASDSVVVPEGQRVTVETGAAAYFGTVILEIDHVDGDVDGDIGVDDLNFDQTADAVLLGDVNLDNLVNGLDVDPFVGLVTGGEFQIEADMNQDGDVNGLDVDPFVAAVVGGGEAAAVPEPTTLMLLLVGFGLVGALRVRRQA